MKIIRVSTEQYFRYIPLLGWASVEAALKTYTNGFLRGSRYTSEQTEQEIRQHYGSMAEALFIVTPLLVDRERSIADEILPEAENVLKERDQWRRHFDYDGMGTPFFKTSVEIKVIDRELEIYGLSFNAAYVGDEPEADLADYLKIPRALMKSSVIIQTEPVDDDHFSFNFEQVIRKLDHVLGTNEISGNTIAQAMMKFDQGHGIMESKPGFLIRQEEDFQIYLSPGRVEDRFLWHDPWGPERRQLDTWSIAGAVLTGFLDESYNDRTKKEPPSLVISLSDHFVDPGGFKENRPIWQPEKKERVIALTDQIAQALE